MRKRLGGGVSGEGVRNEREWERLGRFFMREQFFVK